MTFILAASVFGGGILGIIGLYLYSGLIKVIGNWLGGKASYDEMKITFAWCNVPIIWSLPLTIAEILLYGKEICMTNTPRIDSSPFLQLSLIAFILIEVIVFIWTLVIILKCISEIQGFSVWKAFINILLALLIIFIPAAIFFS